MKRIVLDLHQFSQALVSLGESISHFGRSIVNEDPDEIAEGEGFCTNPELEEPEYPEDEECVADEPDEPDDTEEAEEAEEPVEEDSGECEEAPEEEDAEEEYPEEEYPEEEEAEEEPESEPEPEPEPVKAVEKVVKTKEPAKGDRMEMIRRTVERLGIGIKSDKAQAPEDPEAARKAREKAELAKDEILYGKLPKRAMGLPDMDKWTSQYMAERRLRKTTALEEIVQGRDYMLEGRLYGVHCILSNGVVIVNSRGTRYYKAVPRRLLSDLYPCPARPEHAGDISVGDDVYVGYGDRGAEKAVSYRKARFKSLSRNGTADVVFADTGRLGACPKSSLAVARLVETVKPKK